MLIWSSGSVTLELLERRDSGFWTIEKGYSTVGQLFDFWRYLGKILAMQGVSSQAILNEVLEEAPPQ